jgi:hypothetical protein
MFDFNQIWQSLLDTVTLQFVSPFWWWVFVGACATGIAGVIGWAFPPLRGFAGAVILAVIAGLTGYRRAEYDVERKAKERAAHERTRRQEQQQQGSNWFWK